MAITTKVGDKGKTSILFGKIIDKTNPILDVCGTMDELNASIGVSRATANSPNIKSELLLIQHKLFIIGAEVATLDEDYDKLKKTINKEDVQKIEVELEELEKYNDINNWFIPGESISSANLEMSRTICRRLEREVLKINFHNENLRIYLNRLSDYLWLLAQKEEYYLRGAERKSTEHVPLKEYQTTI
jgi:cob(I)alamin adenosyltransferase